MREGNGCRRALYFAVMKSFVSPCAECVLLDLDFGCNVKSQRILHNYRGIRFFRISMAKYTRFSNIAISCAI